MFPHRSMRPVWLAWASALLLSSPALAQDSTLDRDGDGLSDFHERHKYGTDPERSDSDGDGLPDGDWNERREFAYTVRTVVQVLPPVTDDVLCDDYQDARVLERRADWVELEVIHYPFSSVAESIAGNPDWRAQVAASPELQRFLEPGATANWDAELAAELRAFLEADGLRVDELDDATLAREASRRLLEHARYQDGFSTFCSWFPNGPDAPAEIYPGLERRAEKGVSSTGLSVEEQWQRELYAKGMFEHGQRGSCTSSAIYLNGCLRALGLPTRIVLCIPLANASDPRELELVRLGLEHNQVRETALAGLRPLGRSWASHTFNEVWVNGRWRRLNYHDLGAGILDSNLFGLITHVATFHDWADGEMARTWGTRQAGSREGDVFAHSNPYSMISVSDRFGAHALIENPPGRGEHERLTVEHAYWYDSPERQAVASLRLDDPQTAGHLLLHVREHFLDRGTEQYHAFYAGADKEFELVAEGQPRLRAHATRGYWVDHDVQVREFYLRIEPEVYASMPVDVEYRLVPRNQAERYGWEVDEQVRIVRSRSPLESEPEDELRQVLIDEVLWSDDPSLPEHLRNGLTGPKPVLLAHLATWPGQERLHRFTARADQRVYLRAPGHPRLSVGFGTGSVSNRSGSTRYVILALGPRDWMDIAPDVAYELQPRNANEGATWLFEEGVRVIGRDPQRP